MDDVIVVGARPSGNNTALALANNGYEVTVIDPKENIGDKLCTGLVGEECFRSYPIEPELVYREINVATLVAPSSVDIQFTTPRPVAKVVDRVAYVSSFAKRAMAAGARYRLGERALKIRTERDSIEVTTNQAVRHRIFPRLMKNDPVQLCISQVTVAGKGTRIRCVALCNIPVSYSDRASGRKEIWRG